jgi:hypothetical protein
MSITQSSPFILVETFYQTTASNIVLTSCVLYLNVHECINQAIFRHRHHSTPNLHQKYINENV